MLRLVIEPIFIPFCATCEHWRTSVHVVIFLFLFFLTTPVTIDAILVAMVFSGPLPFAILGLMISCVRVAGWHPDTISDFERPGCVRR